MTRYRRAALASALLVMVALLSGAPAHAADPPKGTTWTEHYFPSVDGLTMLHADVLRPKGLSDKTETPVIMTVSPYFNHGDSDEGNGGPSNRFYDFLDVSRIIESGYTYVMVDLPGFGGSGGCNDWGGVREQGAVKAAVEWAAGQPWSTGRVGLMGKSYDAWTGLMGIAQQPKGLAAVVAMEPVYAGYRYLYMNGVRFLNSVATPAIFQVYDAQPGSTQDDPMYIANSAPLAYCYPLNLGLQQDDDPSSAFWQERDLLLTTKGAKTPLFLTQGFLETNTKPDGGFDLFNDLAGPNRAWFGQFDHVRGWETDEDGHYLTGRDEFAEEMMRFFDHYVKGVPMAQAPVVDDPNVVVQDALGRYRGEESWPPKDSEMLWNKLFTGAYQDDATNDGAGGSAGEGIWTFSQPLPYDVWLAGEPVLKIDVDAAPRANLAANVYDVAPNGQATLVSRGAYLMRGVGEQKVSLELYGQDWPLRAGHRIGVLVSSSNSDWWIHVPTFSDVTVLSAKVGLPFLTFDRDEFIEGKVTSRLRDHMEFETFKVSKNTVAGSDRSFDLPPRLK
ncbi:MAG: CocE/NonD family hydrolase [Gaiellales bacterium]